MSKLQGTSLRARREGAKPCKLMRFLRVRRRARSNAPCYESARPIGSSIKIRHEVPKRALFGFPFPGASLRLLSVTTELFNREIAEAMKAYEKYIVCINKTPEEFEASLISLLSKAIKAYDSRGPDLRHGIALDKQITVILSQNDGPRPLCGIYFNLHSPYQKQSLPKTVKPLSEPIGGGQPKSEG